MKLKGRFNTYKGGKEIVRPVHCCIVSKLRQFFFNAFIFTYLSGCTGSSLQHVGSSSLTGD